MEKEIIISNRKNKSLSGSFHTPKEKTDEIVLIVHSFKGDKDYQPILGECARALCSKGLAVLRFDCYGSGESDGSFEEATIMSEVEDLQDVMKYVKEKGFNKISLIGISLGTSVCILSLDNSVKCLVLWSPPFSHEWIYERYKPKFEGKNVIITTRVITGEEIKVGRGMLEDFGKVKLDVESITCPTLVVFGTEDHATKIEIVEEYFEKLNCEKELLVIQGGDHDFLNNASMKKNIDKTVSWICSH